MTEELLDSQEGICSMELFKPLQDILIVEVIYWKKNRYVVTDQ